jgi:NAD(P)-dependent dehydrogenase (short-subunit alcohol dehydrogenase family)
MEIGGKTFLVTGGAQGMGRCFTLELARLGANVLFCDLNTEKNCRGRSSKYRFSWNCSWDGT